MFESRTMRQEPHHGQSEKNVRPNTNAEVQSFEKRNPLLIPNRRERCLE